MKSSFEPDSLNLEFKSDNTFVDLDSDRSVGAAALLGLLGGAISNALPALTVFFGADLELMEFTA